jgi:O-phospho-L-seryl-tRNASec:L-selenocysteinyl-tRNA synthase
VWSRIDQKTCLKAITAANLIPIVVELQRVGDELRTDLPEIEARLMNLGPGSVAAVVTTTSCFAPRCVRACVCVCVALSDWE